MTETTNTFKEIEQLESLVGELDYLLNEGVVMNQKDADQLVNLGKQLISIGKSFNLLRP
jgi:hypothetical protein